MDTRTEESAGGVVVDDDRRIVLTARRTFGSELRWGLPKGHLEEGETSQQAAVREVREETGLEVEVVGDLPTIDYWYVVPAGETERVRVHKFVHFFLMRPVGGDPEAHDSETIEVGFFHLEEALRAAAYESEKELVAQAIDTLEGAP